MICVSAERANLMRSVGPGWTTKIRRDQVGSAMLRCAGCALALRLQQATWRTPAADETATIAQSRDGCSRRPSRQNSVQKRSDFSSNVRLRRVSSIEVHEGEGLLANLTAAKIRNGDLPQGRGATPACSRRGSRATWKAGSAAHRREGF